MSNALKLKQINEDVYWGLTKQEFYLIIQKIVGIVTINDEYYEQTGYLHRASYEEGTELLKVILKQQAHRNAKGVGFPETWPTWSERRIEYQAHRKANNLPEFSYCFADLRVWFVGKYKVRLSDRSTHHQDICYTHFQQWVGIMRRSKEMIESLKKV